MAYDLYLNNKQIKSPKNYVYRKVCLKKINVNKIFWERNIHGH